MKWHELFYIKGVIFMSNSTVNEVYEIDNRYYFRSGGTTEPKKDFIMDKIVEKPDQYYVKGEQITFTITLSLDPSVNGALPNMDFTDTIPSSVSINSVKVVRGTGDNPVINGQTITITNVVLASSDLNRAYQLKVTGLIR